MERWETIADRYSIEEEVASGGMGTVYRAKDLETGTPVAVKVLRADSVDSAERFVREATVLAQISHPGIVTYLTHGVTAADIYYIVMEWVEGETVHRRLEHTGLTAAESVALVRSAAEALAEAHRHGIVHRDVKPGNLLLLADDALSVKVIDFGLARNQSEGPTLTRTGVMLGTPGYMAPEQARASREIDPRADVFALGCVLHECLTGYPAFAGDNMLAVRAKILLSEPTRVRQLVPEIPIWLDELVRRMTAREPGQRPRDASEVVALLGGGPIPDTVRRRVTDLEPPTAKPIAAPASGVSTIARRLDTNHDQALVSIVIAAEPGADDSLTRSTMTPARAAARERAVGQALEPFDVDFEFLSDGAIIVTIADHGSPKACAERAARCALALLPTMPGVMVAIATEPGELADGSLLESLIDRGVRDLAAGAVAVMYDQLHGATQNAQPIWLDALTARLLVERFEVVRGRSGFRLHSERTEQGQE